MLGPDTDREAPTRSYTVRIPLVVTEYVDATDPESAMEQGMRQMENWWRALRAGILPRHRLNWDYADEDDWPVEAEVDE